VRSGDWRKERVVRRTRAMAGEEDLGLGLAPATGTGGIEPN
jgi:hypothetical protein